MIASTSISILLASVTLSFAKPLEVQPRTVAALNTAAFQEAQQRDDTATRLFSSTTIKTSTGQCLSVNELSGDFRANLTPIQIAACDGSAGQAWDVITAGKHDDQAGTMLVVNTLTQACLNFDPRRAAGNTVIMFSCGGRADGGGTVTNSQLFPMANSTSFSFAPLNAVGTCFAVTSNNVLDQAPCAAGDTSQSFSFGGGSAPAISAPTTNAIVASTSAPLAVASSTTSDCTSTTIITMTRPRSTASASLATSIAEISASPIAQAGITTTSASSASPSTTPAANVADTNPTSAVPVSRAGGVLQPSAAAESNSRDAAAVRAFSSVSLKAADGNCLFVDPTAGDFRQNLIPVTLQPCTGSAGEKFDLITSGAHNNIANSTLVVSSLTQGCLNFDPRRAAGDTVILFSCGGRADGGGAVTDSQLFTFGGGNSLALAPENAKGATCLVGKNGKLDQAACDGQADQVFTVA